MLALWGIFFPWPYVLCVVGLAVAPLVALAWVGFSDGGVTLNDRSGQGRPSVGFLLLMPGLALGARALLDIKVLDWGPALGIAALIGLAVTALALWAEQEFRTVLWTAMVGLFALDYGWGLASQANYLLDWSHPRVVRAAVLEKTLTRGRGDTFYFRLFKGELPELPDKVDVPSQLYERTIVGTTICVWVYRGALGWRWYEVDACPVEPLP